jgi:hypothetical protein
VDGGGNLRFIPTDTVLIPWRINLALTFCLSPEKGE